MPWKVFRDQGHQHPYLPTTGRCYPAALRPPTSGTADTALLNSNLQKQWATLTPAGVKLSAYSQSTASLSPPACPTSTKDGWKVNGNAMLPSLGQTLEAAATASVTASSPASPSASSTGKGTAAGGKEVAGMGLGLLGVMLGFVVWL